MQYETGAVVQLKSGGMKMTVRLGNSSNDSMVACQWMDISGDVRQATFPAAMLAPAPDEVVADVAVTAE